MLQAVFRLLGRFIIYLRYSLCYFTTFDYNSDQLLMARIMFHSIFIHNIIVVETTWDQILA